MATRPRIGVIGAGKVGQTLALLLHDAGYSITAVHSRTLAHAQKLAEQVHASVTNTPEAVLEAVDLVLLTVPDDVIAPMADRLAQSSVTGKAIVHTSGALDTRSLAALAAGGARVGGLHPVYPFAAADSVAASLAGVTFAIETEDAALMDCLGDIVRALNGTIMTIPAGGKAAYHAALVIASNYTVVLYDVARRILLSLGSDENAVDQALLSLMTGTIANLKNQGVPDALTGPLVRGDTGTIAAHLAALNGQDGSLTAMYRDIARLALPMLSARGVNADAIKDLLDQDEKDATDHS